MPNVQSAFAAYVSHLYTDANAPNWDEVRQDYLARLLHHMSVEMKMPLSEATIRSGGMLRAGGPSGTRSSNICTTWR